jgi:hypothetical protein
MTEIMIILKFLVISNCIFKFTTTVQCSLNRIILIIKVRNIEILLASEAISKIIVFTQWSLLLLPVNLNYINCSRCAFRARVW